MFFACSSVTGISVLYFVLPATNSPVVGVAVFVADEVEFSFLESFLESFLFPFEGVEAISVPPSNVEISSYFSSPSFLKTN